MMIPALPARENASGGLILSIQSVIRIARAVAPLVAALTLFGCAAHAAPMPFTSGGAKLPLRMSSVSRSGATETRFTLAKPVSIGDSGTAFILEYLPAIGGRSLRLDLGSGPEGTDTQKPIDATLPGSGGSAATRPMELQVPLPAGMSLKGFTLSGGEGELTTALRASGIAPLEPGIALSPTLFRISDGFTYVSDDASNDGAHDRLEQVSFPAVTKRILTEHPGDQVQAVVSYTFDQASAAASGSVELAVSSAGETRSFRLTQNPGKHAVYLYTASLGFSPDAVKITSNDPQFHLAGVQVRAFEPSALPADTPIPADLGTVLTYTPRDWRKSDYELFSWSLFPSVLVFDFRNYDVQGRFLSRLAYFVEKKGFAGTLLTNQELGNLHGWNAHDYRPQDIARFYQTAAVEHFRLRPEEIELRGVLQKRGVIKQAFGAWQPGSGAIISIAQSSWAGLRYLLLTHEATHGIYFTTPKYREDVGSIWESIGPQEQLFWRLFLGSQEYNTGDNYLVVNEFQAYLMQQTLAQVDARYKNWAIGNIEKLVPRNAPELEAMMSRNPLIFLDTAKKLDGALYRDAGVHAGELVTLQPIRP